MNQKIFLKNPLDCQSSATRKWSCLLNNFHLADVIEKYASVLEIDNAVSSTNNENQQDAVDTAIAA